MNEETRTFTAAELREYSDVIAKAEREACAAILDQYGRNLLSADVLAKRIRERRN